MTDKPDDLDASRGRPTVYTAELGEAICALLAEGENFSTLSANATRSQCLKAP